MSPIEEAERLRTLLFEEISRVRTEADQRIAEIETEIADIEAYLLASDRLTRTIEKVHERLGVLPANNSPLSGVAQDSPLYGKGIPGASVWVLSQQNGPMHTSAITQELQARGFRFAAKNPDLSVDWALKQMVQAGKVEKVGTATWALVPNADGDNEIQSQMPKAELDRSAITTAGLLLAKERGVQLGRPSKLTTDQRETVMKMVKQGSTVVDIARAVGVSRNGMHRIIVRWRQEGIIPADERKRGGPVENLEAPES